MSKNHTLPPPLHNNKKKQQQNKNNKKKQQQQKHKIPLPNTRPVKPTRRWVPTNRAILLDTELTEQVW